MTGDRWELWDATEDPDALALVRRSSVAEGALAAAGWTPLGILGSRRRKVEGEWEIHPDLADTRRSVWRSPDGRSIAIPTVEYGVHQLELASAMADGTVAWTTWYSVRHGVRPWWRGADPNLPPPARAHTNPMMWGHADGLTSLELDALDHPECGLRFLQLQQVAPADVLRRHAEHAQPRTATEGSAVLLDLPLTAALLARRRGVLLTGVDRVGVARSLALMAGTAAFAGGAIAGFVPALRAWRAGGVPSEALLWLSEWQLSGPLVAGLACVSFWVGVALVRWPGMVPIGVTIVPFAWGVSWMPGAGHMAPLVGTGVLSGSLWARLAYLPTARALWPVAAAVLGPRGVWPAVEQLRAVPLREGGVEIVPPHSLPPTPRAEAVLHAAQFQPAGGRKIAVDDHPEACTWVPIWLSADGHTAAEVFDEPGAPLGFVLRSLAADGTVLETRSQPDPGMPLRHLKQKSVQPYLDLPVVTRTMLDRAAFWPSRAVLRVADRPALGLRVSHADGPAGALAEHRRRLGLHPLIPSPTGLPLALALARWSEARQPEPWTQGAHASNATMWAAIAVGSVGLWWEESPRGDAHMWWVAVAMAPALVATAWDDGKPWQQRSPGQQLHVGNGLFFATIYVCLGSFVTPTPRPQLLALYVAWALLLMLAQRRWELYRRQ